MPVALAGVIRILRDDLAPNLLRLAQVPLGIPDARAMILFVPVRNVWHNSRHDVLPSDHVRPAHGVLFRLGTWLQRLGIPIKQQ